MSVLREDTFLYLVPTPIGNLDDITLRAISVLKEVDTILAEDTRTSGVLLKHLSITTKLQSYHTYNEHKVLQGLVARMKEGEKMALITDAGTPGISDPGFLLVRACLSNNLKTECLPGATAFVPALVKSGFPSDAFVFEGFLPQKKGRKTALNNITEEKRTVIFYESPFRLVKTLKELALIAGEDRLVSVSREISKLYEETITDSLKEVATYFETKGVKGEIVVVLSAKDKNPM